jgi:internalin A
MQQHRLLLLTFVILGIALAAGLWGQRAVRNAFGLPQSGKHPSPVTDQYDPLSSLAQASTDESERFPMAIIRAWNRAGAVFGWMSLDDYGELRFRQGIGKRKLGEWPAFRFLGLAWEPQKLASLPPPGEPFGLNLHHCALESADLKELVRFEQLQVLNLDETFVTDTALQQVKKLSALRAISLGGTQVTDSGISELTQLQSLDPSHMVTGKSLRKLKSLRAVNLEFTRVTDMDLSALKELTDLRALNLAHTSVTSAGLRELRGLRLLTSLDLSRRQVSEADLHEIRQFTGNVHPKGNH